MFDERAYVDSVDQADPDTLADMLSHPSYAEEAALRKYLGDVRFQRLHGLALKLGLTQGDRKPTWNVVVIPGIMGSVLSTVGADGVHEEVWLRTSAIFQGHLERLRVAADGRTNADRNYHVTPTGIMKRHYGEMLLMLMQDYNVQAFWYDWRHDLREAADALAFQLGRWFDDQAPVHLVAHAVGGLVARAFIQRHPARWEAMRGKLLMLGTPNYGYFVMLQALMGQSPTVQALARIDGRFDLDHYRHLVSTFPSAYQLFPSPDTPTLTRDEKEGAREFYDPQTFGDLDVPPHYLSDASSFQRSLLPVVDPQRMVYLGGNNTPTVNWIKSVRALRQPNPESQYDFTFDGDGLTPHRLGRLITAEGAPIPAYFFNETHGELPANRRVLAALPTLLETGELKQAETRSTRGQAIDKTSMAPLLDEMRRRRDDDMRQLGLLLRRTRGALSTPTPSTLSTDERMVEELVTRHLMPSDPEQQASQPQAPPIAPTPIQIRLIWGQIEKVHQQVTDDLPIDAIAVGHYIGSKPTGAERALDEAISTALRGKNKKDIYAERLLVQYSERGALRGDLGQPFFLPDPRPEGQSPDLQRVIAIAGMGMPGRFALPEVTIMVRELCWALGRLGKRHLATVLIGTGIGNMEPSEAVNGWIRGIKYAITGTEEGDAWRLNRVTFVEGDPRRLEAIHAAILAEKARLEKENRMSVQYEPPRELLDETTRRALRRHTPQEEPEAPGDLEPDTIPTRMTITFGDASYRFGAITETASVPEREIKVDPRLVAEANKQLSAEWSLARQAERGAFLGSLLLPDDLEASFFTDNPLVLILDSTMARIHWEMMIPVRKGQDARSVWRPWSRTQASPDGSDFIEAFFGTTRGLTRQLLTVFAAPPDPPLPRQRMLRVLVVADPAADKRLPGAEEEGVEVADLFESFNDLTSGPNRVEVKRLFGPYEATRLNVLNELTNRSYDVLHFAGHCFYDETNPAASGWIFSDGETLTANELRRIDRVPNFVFSNACESGVTPDRSEASSVGLAPTFAESFFARGVSNFVCTAWPVYDTAARFFALKLYSQLLGVPMPGVGKNTNPEGPPIYQPIYVAMREARRHIYTLPDGVRCWGAYQHYGTPYLRFFHPNLKDDEDET